MPHYWYLVEALIALHGHRKAAQRGFSRAELRAWSEKISTRPRSAQLALDHLLACGLAHRTKVDPTAAKPGQLYYVLTADGAAAAKAAHEVRMSEDRAARCVALNQATPRDRTSFLNRLWALLRMRRAITAPEAAATLVDAGGNVARAAETAQTYLYRWAQMFPGAIQTSAHRVDGALRYVVVNDLGPEPPVIPTTKKARGAVA